MRFNAASYFCSASLIYALALASAANAQFKVGDQAIVSSPNAKLRLGDVETPINVGTRIQVTTIKNDWVGGAALVDGKASPPGWIHSSDLTVPHEYAMAVRVLSDAVKQPRIQPVALMRRESVEDLKAGSLDPLLKLCHKDAGAVRLMYQIDRQIALRQMRTVLANSSRAYVDQDLKLVIAILAAGAAAEESAPENAKAVAAMSLFGGDEKIIRATVAELGDAAASIAVERAELATPANLAKAFKVISFHDRRALGATIVAKLPSKPESAPVLLTAIADTKSPMAIDVLREFLHHESASVRAAAFNGLTRLSALNGQEVSAAVAEGTESMPKILVDALLSASMQTKDEKVVRFINAHLDRPSGVLALGRLQRQEDIPKLLAIIRSEAADDVRLAAARSIGRYEVFDDFDSLMTLVADSKLKSYQVRQAVAKSLVQLGDDGFRAACKSLETSTLKDSILRDAITEAVCNTNPVRADWLIELVDRLGPTVGQWRTIAESGARLESAESLMLDERILRYGDGWGQRIAIERLASTPAGQDLLLKSCGFPNVLPRRDVNFGTPEEPVADALWLVLNMPSVEKDIWKLVLDALPADKQSEAKRKLLQLARQHTKAAQPLRRAGAIRLLASESADPTTRKAIVQATEDENENVRSVAVGVLAELPVDHFLATLEKLASDDSEDVRTSVASLVSRVNAAEHGSIVDRLLSDTSSDVRIAAVGATAFHPEKLADFVASVKKISDHNDQRQIVSGARSLPKPLAQELLSLLAEKAEYEDLAIKAIAEIQTLWDAGQMTLAQLEQLLKPTLAADDDERRLAAACVLSDASSSIAEPVLIELLKTNDRRPVLATVEWIGKEVIQGFEPGNCRVAVYLRFRAGSESFGLTTITRYRRIRIGRQRLPSSFVAGDRWPLDLRLESSEYVNGALVALGAMPGPTALKALREHVRASDRSDRMGVVWGAFLRRNRTALEWFLNDGNKDVVSHAAKALRLLGHRESLSALHSKVDTPDAVMAVVEISHQLGRSQAGPVELDTP